MNLSPTILKHNLSKKYLVTLAKNLKKSTNAPPLKHSFAMTEHQKKKKRKKAKLFALSRTQTQIFVMGVWCFTDARSACWVRETNLSMI